MGAAGTVYAIAGAAYRSLRSRRREPLEIDEEVAAG
jgi:hypothetical protein